MAAVQPRLAKLVLHVGHASHAPKTHRLATRLAAAFGTSSPAPTVGVTSEPDLTIQMGVPKDRVVVSTSSASTRLDVNWPDDRGRAAALLAAYFDRTQKVVLYDEIDTVAIGSVWVWPTDRAFEEWAAAFRDAYMIDNPLARQATDYSVAFTIDHEGNSVNFAGGVVRPAELARWSLVGPQAPTTAMQVADIVYVLKTPPSLGSLATDAVYRNPMRYSGELAELSMSVVNAPGRSTS